MLKVATADEMQYIDRITIEKYGITGTVLMERAGLAAARRINELFFKKPEQSLRRTQSSRTRIFESCHMPKVLILCGGGNNGGDGFVVARILHNQGRDVEVFLTVKPGDLKNDARVNYIAAKKFGVKITSIKRFISHFPLPIKHKCLIVDSLLGTGLRKEVRGPLSLAIRKINKAKSPVISIDIPSGISSDTGQVMGVAVKAHTTVTFGLPKRGHLLYPGAEYSGEIFIEDIGFPGKLLASEKITVNLPEKNDMISFLPARPKYSHKRTYGHVLLVAGSKGKTGAAIMAAKSCMRAGAGLVTIGVPETLENVYQSRVTEEMILPLPDKGNGTLSYHAVDNILRFLRKGATVLAIGPGLSCDHEIEKLIEWLIPAITIPVVIDADGLNALSANVGVLKKSKTQVTLTPHSGEMARLIGIKVAGRRLKDGVRRKNLEKEMRSEIERDRINTAVNFCKKMKICLVLKGVPTITVNPEGETFVNQTGNAGMATAGTGDVLTGMISGFLAQGLTPQRAKGKHSIVASDIMNAIPRVFRSLQNLP
jgi:NAD(P)H-hydrate epimerase